MTKTKILNLYFGGLTCKQIELQMYNEVDSHGRRLERTKAECKEYVEMVVYEYHIKELKPKGIKA